MGGTSNTSSSGARLLLAGMTLALALCIGRPSQAAPAEEPATLVSLNLRDVPASHAYAAFAKQAGVAVVFKPRVFWGEKEPEPRVTSWLRASADLGDVPLLHACALAYLSDENLLGAAVLAHSMGGRWEDLMTASLDHALWFHRPTRADRWLLVDARGHGVANARGLGLARVFDETGRLVASIAQEGLVRPRRVGGT